MDNTRYKILLIEDDKIDQMAFKRLVENEELPYDCEIAGSVSEAQSMLRSEKFDVVIADYLLGDGTAFDILDLVKNTPFIFVTGAGNEEVVTEAWKSGAYDYLIKDSERNYLKTVPITVKNAIKHKQIEKTIDQKQKNLEAIFDAVPIGMLLVDENLIVKRANNAIRQMVNREYSQIINRTICSSLGCINSPGNKKGGENCPACATCTLIKTVKAILDLKQPVYEVEINPTLKVDEKEIKPWFSVCVTSVTIDDCKLAVVAINDITDRRQAEEKLKEAMEIKSQFISTVSHELRTPLTCVKNAIANTLDGTAGKINDKQRNFLDIAKRNIDRLALLVNDILDFQKLEAGRKKLNMQLNSVSEVVQEVYKTMVSYAEEKQINFTIEFEDNLPKARFDSIKIIQVLTNLVGNSIKFTPKQGKVSVRVQCRDEELVISVSDTGMGIPKEALSRIFERFYCVHRPGKQVQGTGLGLAIVNKIVKMHSGRIEVESEVDHGTTVTVFLPLHIKRLPEVSPEEASSLSE